MRPKIMDDGLPIGAASQRSGVKVPTIRYYEQIGLLPKTARTQSNRRLYGAVEMRRLVFIRRARELGFEVDTIKALLALQDDPDQSCVAADAIARARINEIDRRIESLLSLKSELQRMISDCSCGRVAECRVIEVLASDNAAGHAMTVSKCEKLNVSKSSPLCPIERTSTGRAGTSLMGQFRK